MKSIRGEAIGPLREAFTKGPQELLATSLQMIALTLCTELQTSATAGKSTGAQHAARVGA